jgi:hypothetical protein
MRSLTALLSVPRRELNYTEGRFDDDPSVRDHGIPDALLSRYASSANVVYALEINGDHAGELGISACGVVQLQ